MLRILPSVSTAGIHPRRPKINQSNKQYSLKTSSTQFECVLAGEGADCRWFYCILIVKQVRHTATLPLPSNQ